MTDAAVDTALLATPRFRLLLAGRAVSVLGNALGPVALAFAVLDTTGATAADLSLVLAAQSVTQLVLLLAGGVIADRSSRHHVLVAGEVLAGCGYAILSVAVLAGTDAVGWLVGGAVLSGAGSALLLPALTRVVVDVVDRSELQRANATLRIATHTASVAGLLTAGTVVAAAGPGVALALDAGTFFVAAAIFLRLRLPRSPRPTSPPSLVRDLREGAAAFRTRPWLPTVVVSAAVVNAGTAATFGVLGPVVSESSYGGAGPWSLVLAGYTVGTLAALAATVRVRPHRPLVWCALATPWLALPTAALGADVAWPVTLLAAALAGAALSAFSVLWETTLQRAVPEHLLARVTSVNYLMALSLKPIALAAVGAAVSSTGVGPVATGLVAIMLTAGLAPLLSPSTRTLTTEEEAR